MVLVLTLNSNSSYFPLDLMKKVEVIDAFPEPEKYTIGGLSETSSMISDWILLKINLETLILLCKQ